MRPEAVGLLVAVLLLVGYLIYLRQRERKKQRQDIQRLQIGDEVLTTSGFLAVVKDIDVPEDGPVVLWLDLGSGLEVRALTTAIAQRVAHGAVPSARKAAGGERKGV